MQPMLLCDDCWGSGQAEAAAGSYGMLVEVPGP
jgi:hypothetical protein